MAEDQNTVADTNEAASAEKAAQTVTVEDIGPARKALTIEIPPERIAEKIEASFGRLRDDAVLPGFRRGRAPQRLLEKRFGSSLRDEVRGQLISESYAQAIEEQKLEIIGDPEIKDIEKIELPEKGPLTYRVEVEISPKVELPPFDAIEVTKPKIEVDEAKVNEEIDRIQTQHGAMKSVDGAEVGEKDFIQADVQILAGEKADPASAEQIQHEPNAYILVNGEDREFRGHVLGIVVDDLGKQLLGKKAGETVTISTKGPVGHENEKIKDQPLTIVIRIDKVERVEPAALEDLVKQLGMESVEQLRERVKQMLESRRDREQQSAMHKQVCDYLVEKVDLTLPEKLTARQAARGLQRQAMELSYQGLPQEEIAQKIADLRASSQEDAVKQLKLFFILDQAAKTLDIDVSEGEINGRVAMMAMQQGRRPEKVRQEMQRRGELEHLYLQIREQKTLDKIIGSAKVTEVDAPAEEPKDKPAKGPKKSKKK